MSDKTGYMNLLFLFVGCILILVLGVFDYVNGKTVSTAFLYFIPVSIIAWFASRREAFLIATLSAISWLVVDIINDMEYPNASVRYGLFVMHLTFFVFVAVCTYYVRMAIIRQKEAFDFIVHDMKSPLSTILIGMEMLSESPELVSTQTKKLVRNAIASGNKILTMIHSVSDISKIEKKRFIVHIEEFELKKLIDTSLEQVAMFADKRGVSILTHIDPGLGKVKTDFWLVARILINLLGNAIEASPDNTKVELAVNGSGDKNLLFTVTDAGPGIEDSLVSRLVDGKYKVAAHKGGSFSGGGLGIRFCYLASKQLGGGISIRTSKNSGSAISLKI